MLNYNREFYDNSYWPTTVSIVCPKCAHEALFSFVHLIRIENDLELIEFFKKSRYFDYFSFKDEVGYSGYGVKYFEQLFGPLESHVDSLPPKLIQQIKNNKSEWFIPFKGVNAFCIPLERYNQRVTMVADKNEGSWRCYSCYRCSKHVLNWPIDAYYSVEYKGQILWAFNKESAQEVLAYLQQKKCNKDDKYYNLIKRIPAIFTSSKARDSVIKKLIKRLG